MVMGYIANRLKALILILIGALRRAFCCFRRRRRSSVDITPFTGVGVGETTPLEEIDWQTWDAPTSIVTERSSMSFIEQRIEEYRQQSIATLDIQPEADLFEDMAPRITAQPRLLLKTTDSDTEDQPSRLGLAFDPTLAVNSELESWEDSPSAWEDQDSMDSESILREKRQAERERRRGERRGVDNKRPQLEAARLS